MQTPQTANDAKNRDSDAALRMAPEADGAAFVPARLGGAAVPGPLIDAGPAPPPDMSAFGHALAYEDGTSALGTIGPRGLVYLQRHAGNRAVVAFVTRSRKAAARPTVARVVNPTPVARRTRVAVLGDGSAARKGMKVGEFEAYVAQQADWFTEASLSAADRTGLWNVANLLAEGSHMGSALGELRLTDLIAAMPAFMIPIRAYANGASGTPNNVRITDPDTKISRVKELGAAMVDLATFVPGAVLQVVVTQAGLRKLTDEKLVDELRKYYADFTPTIENPEELKPLLTLLRGKVAKFNALKDWVHDLHHLTPATRLQLVKNVTDTSRKRPVMLILMSGLDWNAAFLQADNLEAAVKNPKNLALVLQGSKSLADATARVNKTADDYGQIPTGSVKGRLGQVVIAGHGQSTTVEQATPGTGATTTDDKTVGYTQTDIHPSKPGDDSELLIDAILTRMDPADARVVFAGCLVGSHDIPETPDLANHAKAAAEINAAITADPNLRDLVEKRMAALAVTGKVEAANASTTFGAFNLDSKGKARLSLIWDPNVGGPKAKYVRTGAEPEGALRAALETWADPALGPAWTTNEMRKHVNEKKSSKEWWQSLTVTAYRIALPAAGDVDPAILANLAHRAEAWLLAGWPDSASVDRIVASVTAAEAPILYPVMLKSSDHPPSAFPHLPIVVQEAWMAVDAAHEANFMTAIGKTSLERTELAKHLSDAVVDPHLPSVLVAANPAKPTKAQLLLALTIAVARPGGMPPDVLKLLTDAAGGRKTAKFPAGLKVPGLLDGASELGVLRSIGLAPGAAPALGGGGPLPDDANVDIDADLVNETFVAVAAKSVAIGPDPKDIRAKPDKMSTFIGNLAGGKLMIGGADSGSTIQVVGMAGGWTAVDMNGTIGFVDGPLP